VCGPRSASAPPPTITPIPGGVELRSRAGIGCTTVPAPALSSEGVYRVQFKFRVTDGNPARFACLWQAGPERCATIEQPTAIRGWATFDTVVRTEPGVTALTLFLYAQATDRPADVQYRDVSITPLRTVGLAAVDSTTRPPLSRFLERGDHTLEVSRPSAALELRPDSPVGDCNRSDNRSAENAGLDVRSIAGGVRLTARAHSACVTAALPAVVAGGNYTLDLDVRTVSGARARLCVWQFGPNRCAEIEDVPASNTWTRYRTNITFDPGTRAARIYLYADGQDDGIIGRDVNASILNQRCRCLHRRRLIGSWEHYAGTSFFWMPL
jgi:arabinofuranan 3-O-arabinosyltransferase